MIRWWGYLLSLVVRMVGIKPLANLDGPCPVCGLTDGWHEDRL